MIDLNPQRVRRLRRLATVPRWVVVPMIQKQSVAEHSFAVAYIALWVAQYHPVYKLDRAGDFEAVMYYALIHDEMEALTGDLPSPATNYIPDKSKKYEQEHNIGAANVDGDLKLILKVADLLEAYLFVNEDQKLGNQNLGEIEANIYQRLHIALNSFPFEDQTARFTFISEFLKYFNPSLHPIMHDLV